MLKWVCLIKRENPPARYVLWEGPEDTLMTKAQTLPLLLVTIGDSASRTTALLSIPTAP